VRCKNVNGALITASKKLEAQESCGRFAQHGILIEVLLNKTLQKTTLIGRG
jgi:hypothetical protein